MVVLGESMAGTHCVSKGGGLNAKRMVMAAGLVRTYCGCGGGGKLRD